MDNQKTKDIICALAISLALVVVLCMFFQPRWETNDDVGMSMIAHGYGIAASGTPNLLFSNIIWGYLVRSIPAVNGVLGYSIATLTVLLTFGTVILYALRKMGLGWLIASLVVTLLLVRPVLFPQFTINAGLLTVGAVVCWHLYGEHGGKRTFLVGCLLAFGGFLIRSQEFLLVVLIALPLLPWKKLAQDRFVKVAVASLLVAIFGADRLLKAHPEILSRHGYSENDIDLVRNWFFVDNKIVNPSALNAMLTELGPIPFSRGSFVNGWVGIKTLMHPVLIPGVLVALLLLLMRPNRKLFLVWGLCFVAFFFLGMLGRPGRLRVYIPILPLLVIAPLLIQGVALRGKTAIRHYLVYGVIFIVTIFNTVSVFSESKAEQVRSESIRSGFDDFPDNSVILWGAEFPYESVYPVLKQSDVALKYQLYALGVSTLAPFSRAHFEQSAGRGLIDLLISKNGVSLVANEQHYGFLNNYCNEHLHGVLKELASRQYESVRVAQFRCDIEAN